MLTIDQLVPAAFPPTYVAAGSTIDIACHVLRGITAHRFTCDPYDLLLHNLRIGTVSLSAASNGPSLAQGLDWTFPREHRLLVHPSVFAVLCVHNPTAVGINLRGAALWGAPLAEDRSNR